MIAGADSLTALSRAASVLARQWDWFLSSARDHCGANRPTDQQRHARRACFILSASATCSLGYRNNQAKFSAAGTRNSSFDSLANARGPCSAARSAAQTRSEQTTEESERKHSGAARRQRSLPHGHSRARAAGGHTLSTTSRKSPQNFELPVDIPIKLERANLTAKVVVCYISSS